MFLFNFLIQISNFVFCHLFLIKMKKSLSYILLILLVANFCIMTGNIKSKVKTSENHQLRKGIPT